MSKFAKPTAIVAIVIVTVISAGTLYFVSTGDEKFTQCGSDGVVFGESMIGGPFELINGEGKSVTHKDVIRKPALIYFGFTNCPGVCPVDNSRNAAAVELLAEQNIDATPVFITVDPDRDTSDRVKEFTGYFHENMIGLTGSPEQIAKAAEQYRVFYNKRPARSDGFYMVDHSTQTFLELPGHGVVDFFKRDDSPEKIAEITACYARAGGFT